MLADKAEDTKSAKSGVSKISEFGFPEDDIDDRLEFILSHLIRTIRIKHEKWNKMMATDEYKHMVMKFLDTVTQPLLIMITTPGGTLQPSFQFTHQMKTKAAYFIKKKPEQVTVDNFREILLAGDMACKPVEELAVLVEQVYAPLLCNRENHKGWPKVVSDDMVAQIAAFKNTVYQVKGALKSQTLLPMPNGLERIYDAEAEFLESEGEEIDLNLLSAIEGAVLRWVSICTDILKQRSDSAFVNGAHPTPMREVEFWDARLKNLECVYDQLRDHRVKKMADYLEATESSYLSCFKEMFKNVTEALLETRDICLYLKPLIKHFKLFESNDFLDLKPYIKPLVHVVAMLWAHSRYYCDTEKIVILLKEIANLLIEGVSKQLKYSSIFRGDPDEMNDKMKKCIQILELFQTSFAFVRANLDYYFKDLEVEMVPWTFHPRCAFQRLIDFLDRLRLLSSILETAIEFAKLEKVEIGGIRGRLLSQKVVNISEEFNLNYAKFTNLQYDFMIPEDHYIVSEFKTFKIKCDDLEMRLAAIFEQAYDECHNLESVFKFLNVVGSLIERPLIGTDLMTKLPRIVKLMDEEVDSIKILYDNVKNSGAPIDNYLPPTAGYLLWLHKLRRRIEEPANEFKLMESVIVETDDTKRVFSRVEDMLEMINNDGNSLFTSWCAWLPQQIDRSLSKTFLHRNKKGLIQVNLDGKIAAILREIRYMKVLNLGYDLHAFAPDAVKLFERNEELIPVIMELNRIVEWYNFLRQNTLDVENIIIEDEMHTIDTDLEEIIATLTWRTNSEKIVSKIFKKIKHLYIRVSQAQKNVTKMLDSIQEWGKIPLYARKENRKDMLLLIDDKEKKIFRRYSDILQTSKLIEMLLEKNYNLYFDIQISGEVDETAVKTIMGKPCDGEVAIDMEEKPVPRKIFNSSSPKPVYQRKKPSRELLLDEDRPSKEITEALSSNTKWNERKYVEGEARKEAVQTDNAEELGVGSGALSQEDKKEIYIRDVKERREKWMGYEKYIDDLVASHLIKAVGMNLELFLDEMGDAQPVTPLFEISLELHEPNVSYLPSVYQDEDNSFISYVNKLINNITDMGLYMARASGAITRPNYHDDILSDKTTKDLIEDILARVRLVLSSAMQYEKKFEEFSYLWLDDRQETLQQFLTYGRQLSPEEIDHLNSPRSVETANGTPTVTQFKEQIDFYEDLYKKLEKIETSHVLDGGWLRVNVKPVRQAILNTVCKWGNVFKQHLYNYVTKSLNDLEEFIKEAVAAMQKSLDESDYDGLIKIMLYLYKVKERQLNTDTMFDSLKQIMDLLDSYGVEFPEEVHVQLEETPEKWAHCKKVATRTKTAVTPIQALHCSAIRRRIALFDIDQQMYRDQFKKLPLFSWNCPNVYLVLDKTNKEITELETEMTKLTEQATLFDLLMPDFKALKVARREVKQVKNLWDYVNIVRSCVDLWKMTQWRKLDVETMEMECKKFGKEIRAMDKELRSWDIYLQMEATIKNMLTSLRAVTELQNPAIRERHWVQLMKATKVAERLPPHFTVKFVMDDSTTLNHLLMLNLHEYEEQVKNIVDKAVKEMAMEKVLRELNVTWSVMEFDTDVHGRTQVRLLQVSEELIETLEENQVALQNMMTSKYIDFFLEQVSDWQRKLSNADQVITVFLDVQRKWCYLESIFIGSEDIRSQLPEDSRRFEKIDREFKQVLQELLQNPNVVKITNMPGLFERLEAVLDDLTLCEKALNNYLDTKRLAFPRFYFVSSADLLDILSNGNQPELIVRHLTKLFDSLARLVFIQENGEGTKKANEMISKENEEHVKFVGICECSGKVEVWLNRVIDIMRLTLHERFGEAVSTYDEKSREIWIFDYAAQPALCSTQIWWNTEVNLAFGHLEEGYENALKEYQRKQITQLNALISLLLGDLSAGDRQKIMTICTIDVHSRDVVAKMIVVKVENSQAFQWQSQLRHRWDFKIKDCFANICDAQFRYQYEYLGNTPRLVITPLTDRCYITLTQSLHLIMGGAPAGPAGTGKTETTKDLGKALGMMVYVFNCSEQMDYKSIGNIYKGLAQTGCWGCFDEFNRISVEVLSVVAVQVKWIQDAIKDKKQRFQFLGQDIQLIPTIGIFITMNPGYAGRTELPENLKALFRPCAMVVPDFELICEIMLVAEGFQDARLLARKFITLYTLCKELLSKQDHYDWGLRAIKSVLVVAGSLKRGDRQRPEDQVLMRALRDFNIPKIVTDDVPVFMGLIGDLFPALDVPRKRVPEFERLVKKSAVDLKLQPEDGFVLKVVQLEELFAVRHSVFVIGNTGNGKSMVWKTLNKTYHNMGRRAIYNDLNPKAVTNDELFGIINPATREWKDGLFSVIMRDQTNIAGTAPKWIVLDGDIDPMWIESLNTLMDDNKVLTLASNERIALTSSMRLLFEIANLRTATPATVSRAGILYINPDDLGLTPYVTSWIDTRTQQSEKANLMLLFDKYMHPCIEYFRTKVKKITPICELAHVQMLCSLLDCMLTPQNVPPDCPKEWYEIYFVFASIWAFGSSLCQDQLVDWRNEFSKWFLNEFKTVKFPPGNSVFHYYIDDDSKKFRPWIDVVPEFELDSDVPLQTTLVNTVETTRIRYFMDLLMEIQTPIMLIGAAGSGKTVIIHDKLDGLPEAYAVTNVPFNFYTTSEMLQKVLEKPLEKKAGRVYGPPGNKRMVYFIDDMNMPEVDKYFTVQPHTLIRQFMDYQHWYDRQKLTLKDIRNVQFVSSMNPTAGSFTINPRLQRHFCVFAVSFPSMDATFQIYSNILNRHLENPETRFKSGMVKYGNIIVNAALNLHQKVQQTFLPTAVKFHYVFNLRDMSNIFQGMLFSTGDVVKNQTDIVRLWMHETTRVYGDKLVDKKDVDIFWRLLVEIVKKSFEELDEGAVLELPLIFCHFAEGIGDPKYNQIMEYSALDKLLNNALGGYNELVAAMNLVLFEDAMNHICRINRIMESPRGNALLVGVGGSGKQSLTRLSAFISSLEVFQVQLKKGYSMHDMKGDLAQLYLKASTKNVSTVFLLTDAQVPEEKFLVLVNDLLASGEIPDLLSDDDLENVLNGMRSEVKSVGTQDTRENCFKFFIEKTRKLLKVVLCFSPVGSTLRVRSRKFPALINCTAIDWFHEWPREALESVSKKFLAEIETLPPEFVSSVSLFMSHVHSTVNAISEAYLQNEKRYNYTTPKSFLEQIALYSKLLTDKTVNVKNDIMRLTNGLVKLASTSEEVVGLKQVLAIQEVELAAKNKAADALIRVLSAENEMVGKEQAIASEEEARVKVIEEDVSAKAKICAEDLQKAEPALLAAQEALNTLNKANLTELRSFPTPPAAVAMVAAAVLVLFSKGKIPRDRSWKECKTMMVKVDKFLDDLVYYDKENIHPEIVKVVQAYINDPEFNPDTIVGKSIAAAGLCAWVINIMKFYDVFVIVEPKRKALAKANAELADARQKLKDLNEKLQVLEKQLLALRAEYEEATTAKLKCQQEADTTATMIDLANRLVTGLASEKIRWKVLVASYKESITTLPGDVLLVTAFISYVGCFTKNYRIDLVNNHWLPFVKKLVPRIPMTNGLDSLSLLTDAAQIASWNNQGLPSDRMSTENAIILTNSARWPLMIDPQLQGIKWIKSSYGEDLKVIRLTMKTYLDVIEKSIYNGNVVLLEFIGEEVDAVLEPVMGRVLIKKGKAIKIGDKEVDYDPRFRLILQTKLANPHYKPEIQAQTTLINFTVTRDGLEEQLLAEVVKVERPDLETLKSNLTKQQNDFKILLKTCEDNLLEKLSSATGNILGDVELVENLERTKKTATEIEVKVEEAKITTVKIDKAREQYRPCAARASLLYFMLNDLNRINAIYQFSLKAFSTVFVDSLARAEPASTLKERVNNFLDSVSFSVFMYTTRGLYVCDKLTFMAHMTFQILLSVGDIKTQELDFLLRYPVVANAISPVDFLSNKSWGGIKSLSNLENFKHLDKDIEGSAKRWKKLVESECPEKEKYPGEWKTKTSFQRLCMIRALRPDRMTYAVIGFVEAKMGSKYITARSVSFAKSFEETNPQTPTFFLLSPGVNPLKDVEVLGKKMGFTFDRGTFHSVSLGQGQEVVAENAMDTASEHGHWVILQNIHLVPRWLATLEKKMEQCSENTHPNYRLYLTAESSVDPHANVIPQGILESSIKITNEPPTGMFANLHKALDNFNQETLEVCTKEAEFKSILFALCYFHAVVAERRKFGPQGWNRNYPFNIGDLTISVNVLFNYLENNSKIPWEDLRYLFGEIMYGGHITDDWDRRLCRTYLSEFMQPELLEGELQLAPGFFAPPNIDYVGYHRYIDERLPPESPYLYGLHPNAEIGFLANTSEKLFKAIFEMQPRDAGTTIGAGMTREDKVRNALDDIFDKLPDAFNVHEMMAKVEDRNPYIIVAFQECERMNHLTNEMKRSLKELDLGLKGELTITSDMEVLEESLFMDYVPDSWTTKAYPSLLPLGQWFADLAGRIKELDKWVGDFNMPACVWLGGFFNPQSFLTAIMQQTARKNEWPLDKMCLLTDVTKKQREDFTSAAKEGAYVYGLFMEGARWDIQTGSIADSKLKELFPTVPVVFIKAITQDKQDLRNMYDCPVYKTRQRGPTFVWTFNLKTKEKASKWTLAGVALLLQI